LSLAVAVAVQIAVVAVLVADLFKALILYLTGSQFLLLSVQAAQVVVVAALLVIILYLAPLLLLVVDMVVATLPLAVQAAQAVAAVLAVHHFLLKPLDLDEAQQIKEMLVVLVWVEDLVVRLAEVVAQALWA
jgi:hypothetical protein